MNPRTSRSLAALGLGAALVLAAAPGRAAEKPPRDFASPEAAVAALIAAARADHPAELAAMLGPGGRQLVSSGDPVADREGRSKFVAAYDEAHQIVAQGEDKAVLEVGKDAWPMPIPLVRHGTAWHFDAKAGEREIIARRIGRNELSAIEVCRAYADAQRDFAARHAARHELVEYAMKFVSSPGRQDGLYWPAQPGEEQSPLGPLVASARAEGYATGKRAPYHGYYYKILKRQGKDAPGGAYDYVADGHMIGGFALIAFPARYGNSGVMSFLINQDGVVYQKDLGAATARLASRIAEFDPDPSWQRVESKPATAAR